MPETEAETIKVLREIRDLLRPISFTFQKKYIEAKKEMLVELLSSDTKKRIYRLLFDPKRLSQIEIAKAASTSQPSVSRLINSLLENGLIEKRSDANGRDIYLDNDNLFKGLEEDYGRITDT